MRPTRLASLLCTSLLTLGACTSPRPAAAPSSVANVAAPSVAPAMPVAAKPIEKPQKPTSKPTPPPPPNPVREEPAPAQPNAHGGLELLNATPEVPADIVIHNAVGKASEDGKDVLVYVGASWCAPCVRFKKAAEAGKFDAKLPGLRILVFDADQDTDRLRKAGYTWTYVPLFVRPGVNGRSSGVQIAGVPNKESGAENLVPRIQKLLGRTK